MTKTPKQADSRAKALAGMNKAELIKTIKALDRKQTQLLNELAQVKRTLAAAEEPYTPDPYSHAGNSQPEHTTPAPPAFPWSTCEGS